MKPNRSAYLYLAAPLSLLGITFLYPVAQAFVMSLQDYRHNLYEPAWVGFQNYHTLFRSPAFLQAAWNTILFVLGVVPAMVTLPILMALLLNGALRGAAFFRTVIYLPVILSMVVVGIAWKWLYAEEGLLNYGLSRLGLAPVGWLVNPDVALWAVMLVIVWKGLGYYMMMYLAHLQSVSQDLYEAATLDGASRFQKHWHVTLPHLRPTMSMVALISIIGSLKLYTEIFVLTGGGPIGSTQTVVYFIVQRAFENLDLGVACAAGILLLMALLAVSWVQLRLESDRSATTLQKARPS